MQTKQRGRSSQTRRNRPNNSKGGNVKKAIPKHGIPVRKRGAKTSNGPTGNNFSHFLNPDFKSLSIFHIDDGSVFDNGKYDPANLPAALEYLYKCLKQIKEFKDDKEWKEIPSIAELADYLFSETNRLFKFSEMAEGCRYRSEVTGFWAFDYDENNKLRLRTYKYRYDLEGSYAMPLIWIPELKNYSEGLYDLAMDILSAVAQSWRLDVITNSFNDQIIDDPDAHTCGDETDEELLRDIKNYQEDGPAYEMEQEMKRRRFKNNLTELYKRVDAFKFKGMFELEIIAWLDLGVKCLENACSIGLFCPTPDDIEDVYNDGDPVDADDMYSFVWCFHDHVFEHADSIINDFAGNCGVIPPIIRTEHFPNKQPKQAGNDNLQKLKDFLEFGRSVYFDHFEKHFLELRRNPEHKNTLLHILS